MGTRVLEDARSKDVGERVFRHHAARYRVDRARPHRQICDITAAHHFHGQTIGQLEIAVPPRGAPAQAIGHGCDLRAQAADKQTEAAPQRPAFLRFVKQRQHLLRLAQGEDRHEHRTPLVERRLQGGEKAVLFGAARHARRNGTVSAGRFHDEHIDVFLRKLRPAHQGLILEIDVARIENPLPFRFKEHTGRTKNVSRIEKFRRHAMAPEVKPFPQADNFPVRRHLLHFTVGEKRKVWGGQLLPLPHHHVDRIVQHHVGQSRRGLGHEDRRTGRLPHGQGKTSHVVLMRVGQHHRIKAPALENRKVRRGQRPDLARMHARIEQDANPGSFEQIAVRPDLLGACEVGEFHEVTG